jgi:hypothetical protein
MNNNTLKQCAVIVFAVLLWFSPSWLIAQNLIVNGDFEAYNIYGQITAPSYTDYQRVNANYVVEAGHYVINTTTSGHGGGQQGWPNPSDSHGKYMIVNGFGGDSNPSKVVWKQTVSVTTQTDYTLSYRYVNLNRVIYGQINPSKLQVKINGANFGGVNTLPTNNNWHDWNNNGTKWNSGNATQAVIEIYDTYTGNEGLGDDFCLDDISFVPDAVYSVTANTDYFSTACYYTPAEIDVLGNDNFNPNSQGATVSIVTYPTHGEATALSNRKIEYIFNDANFNGTDQLKYRVTFHGVYSEAWVFITTGREPQVANITAPGPICAGGALGIPTPSVNPNTPGQWEYSSSSTGTFQPFDPNNVPQSMNGKYVRYSASNDCGDGHSNAVQITVTNGPSFTGQTPQINPICAGGNLNLTPPAYNANGSQILSYGWVASPTATGTYTTFSLNNISSSYNGWYIRYMIEGSCGYVYSDPPRQLTVNVLPDITGTLQAPEGICAGDDLDVTAPTFNGTGTGVWEICQTPSGTYQSFNIQNVPATYNNWYLHYKVSNDCGSDVSNYVQIHVYDAPTIATPATPQAICAGGSFSLTVPSIQNHGATVTNQGWQIAAQQNGTYSAFNNNNVPYTYNGYWIRYFAVNECGETHSASVQITVNDIPVVGNITAPAGICAGQSFSLTTPQIDWRHTNQGTGSWEIAPTSSGDFTALNNNNIPFSYNGYYIRYKAVNGCGIGYSTNVVQVTVYSTEPTYDTITACDIYVWNGVTCYHTGNYQAQVQNANGCTITAHLHFILSDAYTETQTFSSCGSFTWPMNGHTYYSSCWDTLTIGSGNPLICDSIFYLDVTINNAPQITGNISAPSAICAGSPLNIAAPQYVMNHVEGGDAHWEYATSANGPFTAFDPSANQLSCGTYYLRFAVINACGDTYSNVVSFHVDDAPEALMQLSGQQVCEGQSLNLPEINVNWNNEDQNDRMAQWQMSSTQTGTFAMIDPTMPMQMSHNGYWLRFWAHNSCGDDIVGPVQITVLSAEDQWLDTETYCDFYELPSGGVIYESQVIEYEVAEPCFHIVHQPIVINHSDYVVEPITSCHEEEVWHGRTFYYSEQTQYAWDTLTNIHQCDSIVELNLNFDEFSSYTHNRTACGSYVWEMKPDVVYTESVRDSVFVPAVGQDDCDTWYFLELTVGHDTLIEGLPRTECSGFVWHGVPYYEDAVIYDSLKTVVTNCDSVYFYRLTIIPPLSGEESIVSCHSIWWHGVPCGATGDYEAIIPSVQGCDSTVTLHFILSDEIKQYVDTLACNSFMWYGHLFETDEQASHTFLTPQGCDSTVYLNVTFIQPDILPDEPHTACNSYTFHGITYGPGIYEIPHDTVFAQNGCISSVQMLNLTVKDSDQMGAINGQSNVYVASSMISGIYRYEIDTEGLDGPVTWSLSIPDWQIIEQGNDFCRVLVTTPGTAMLIARFNTVECGEAERSFEINAGFFGVDDIQNEVRIFPNPTKGTVTIEAEGIESLRLTNMMGQVLEMRECDGSDSVMLNLNGYAPSVYLLEIKTNYGIAKKRLILCR